MKVLTYLKNVALVKMIAKRRYRLLPRFHPRNSDELSDFIVLVLKDILPEIIMRYLGSARVFERQRE